MRIQIPPSHGRAVRLLAVARCTVRQVRNPNVQTIAVSYWNSRSMPPLHARAPHASKREIEARVGGPPGREVSACAHRAPQAGVDGPMFAVRTSRSNCRHGTNSAQAL